MEEKYILATDYKYQNFSAIFAFEAQEKAFNKMEKHDLLHAYMVCRMILSFDERENLWSNDNPMFEAAATMIRGVLSSIGKQVGPAFREKMEKSLTKIEANFPAETKWIRALIQDEDGLISSSFFVPQIIHQAIHELNSHPSKKIRNLAILGMNNFAWSSSEPIYATLMDIADCWRSHENKIVNKKRADAAERNTMMALKETVQMHLATTGEFENYARARKYPAGPEKER